MGTLLVPKEGDRGKKTEQWLPRLIPMVSVFKMTSAELFRRYHFVPKCRASENIFLAFLSDTVIFSSQCLPNFWVI